MILFSTLNYVIGYVENLYNYIDSNQGTYFRYYDIFM